MTLAVETGHLLENRLDRLVHSELPDEDGHNANRDKVIGQWTP